MPVGVTRNTQLQKVAIRIDEVDIANRVVHGRDKTNVLVVATFRATPSGILVVPAQNDRWIASRIGMGQWHLETRLDSADQQAWAEANMVPGDMRLVANTVHIAGEVVFVPNLPASDPGIVGQLWNNHGALSISLGQPFKTQTAKSRIRNSASVTQHATARIIILPFKTQTAIARVAIAGSKTQSATAHITGTNSLDTPSYFRRKEAVPFLFGKVHNGDDARAFSRKEATRIID